MWNFTNRNLQHPVREDKMFCIVELLCDTLTTATTAQEEELETLCTHMYLWVLFFLYSEFFIVNFFLLLFSVYTLRSHIRRRRAYCTQRTRSVVFFYVSHFQSFWLFSYMTMLSECACFGELTALSFDV